MIALLSMTRASRLAWLALHDRHQTTAHLSWKDKREKNKKDAWSRPKTYVHPPATILLVALAVSGIRPWNVCQSQYMQAALHAASARLPLPHPQASELEATGPVQSVGLLVFIDYPTPIMSRVGRQVKNYHMPRLLSLEYPGSADRRKCYQMPQLRIFVVIEKRKEPENLSRNGSERRKALNTTSIADREKLLALLGVCLRQRNSVRRKCSIAARNDHDNSEIELP